jgi:purine-nucleoside phosphorylase
VGADSHLARELRVEIKKTVEDPGARVDRGTYTTVPFFLAETKEFLNSLQKQGALSVDLELSSVRPGKPLSQEN